MVGKTSTIIFSFITVASFSHALPVQISDVLSCTSYPCHSSVSNILHPASPLSDLINVNGYALGRRASKRPAGPPTKPPTKPLTKPPVPITSVLPSLPKPTVVPPSAPAPAHPSSSAVPPLVSVPPPTTGTSPVSVPPHVTLPPSVTASPSPTPPPSDPVPSTAPPAPVDPLPTDPQTPVGPSAVDPSVPVKPSPTGPTAAELAQASTLMTAIEPHIFVGDPKNKFIGRHTASLLKSTFPDVEGDCLKATGLCLFDISKVTDGRKKNTPTSKTAWDDSVWTQTDINEVCTQAIALSIHDNGLKQNAAWSVETKFNNNICLKINVKTTTNTVSSCFPTSFNPTSSAAGQACLDSGSTGADYTI